MGVIERSITVRQKYSESNVTQFISDIIPASRQLAAPDTRIGQLPHAGSHVIHFLIQGAMFDTLSFIIYKTLHIIMLIFITIFIFLQTVCPRPLKSLLTMVTLIPSDPLTTENSAYGFWDSQEN